ncbi:virion structural protein [Cyanophage S-TIM66]|nr:virion structural protein [Cyanophage S-TIM66]
MADIRGPILPLQLDPRNTPALVRDTQTKIFLESGGQLNDFSAASPLSAIVEGQAYAQSELLYYLNSLPEAFTLQWFRQLGIQRSIGAKAIVEVTFTKVEGFGRVVIIPKGTVLSTVSNLNYILDEEVRINNDELIATGRAVSERWGTVYNVAPGAIQKINLNILGLNTQTNERQAQGGKDLESIENLKTRAFTLLRRRGLISANDYENEIREIAPEASIVKIITHEERERVSEDIPTGVIAVCLGDQDGKELEATIRQNLLKALRKRVPLGTAIYLTSPEVTPLETTVVIEYDDEVFTTGIDARAAAINDLIASSLNIQEIPLGGTFNFQQIKNNIFDFNFVNKVNSLSIKLLKTVTTPTDQLNFCNSPFVSELVNGVCVTDYEATVDNNDESFTNTNALRSFRYYKNTITLIAKSTQAPLTYTFIDPDYQTLLGG